MITTIPASSRTAHDTYAHECHHGFCVVCGSVWPCSRARRASSRQTVPVPRADVLAG